MSSAKVLYTSADVRREIIYIFQRSKKRRVAITAFVGSGAEAYLPRPKGIELICWPKAGGTNPDALRKLIKSEVKVSFADALHMKIYWTEDKGVVITSANLSTNALGAGNLREAGVWLPSEQFDINKVIQKINPSKATKKALDQLEAAHRVYYKVNKFKHDKVRAPTFLEWVESPMRSDWRIGYFVGNAPTSLEAKNILKTQYNISEPEDFISCPVNTYRANDWILDFGFKKNVPILIHWLYVDFVAQMQKSDETYSSKYPCQAVQVWPSKRYPAPPFKIDARFRKALTAALKKFGVSKFKDLDPYKPPKRLIELMQENY